MCSCKPKSNRRYSPYKIGQQAFKDGCGISHLIGAVRHDSDLDEACRGYMAAKERAELKAIKSKMGYSRVGLWGRIR
jgi:hypothetical protein